MIKEARVLEGAASDCITDLQDKYEIKLDTEEEVLDFFANYNGKDGEGETLYNVLGMIMEIVYPGEEILSSPSTILSVIASKDYSKEVSDRYWKLEIKIETYAEKIYLKFILDTETNLVYPGNEDSKSSLDLLN